MLSMGGPIDHVWAAAGHAVGEQLIHSAGRCCSATCHTELYLVAASQLLTAGDHCLLIMARMSVAGMAAK
jgi:hypothetical protein